MKTRIIGERFSRRGWGIILVCAAAVSIGVAMVLQALGLGSDNLKPVPFITALVFIKLGLFTFWPVLVQAGAEASTAISDSVRRFTQPPMPPRLRPRPAPRGVALWNEKDPRLDLGLFSGNVPTLVLDHEQRILDWNGAFQLIFGRLQGVERGAHVGIWYDHLDNFRRVAKRTDKMYGEGILPITDRERVVFVSPEFGRMVFSRIMAPIIDRNSARILGWSIVLNINSVNRRERFFERMHGKIASDTRRLRHVAGFDHLFTRFSPYKDLIALHTSQAADASRVLDIGASTGNLTAALLKDGRKVVAVDNSTQHLRRLRDKCEPSAANPQLRIVRRHLDDLGELPEARFGAANMMLAVHRVAEPVELFRSIHRALKPGATFTISALSPQTGLEGLYGAVRKRLETSGHYEALKHQFAHVLQHEEELALALPYRFYGREDLRAFLIEAGFSLESEHDQLLDGHALAIVARKA